MASLKALRTRIASVTATRKITKAQQMVAVSKLRRAQEAVASARPYCEKMNAVIADLAAGAKNNPGAPKLLAGNGKDQVHLLIVATSDRGLCGGFNTNIVRFTREKIAELTEAGKEVKILCVGRKGHDQLKRQYGDMIVDAINFTGVKHIAFENAEEIGTRVLKMFDDGEFDVATLIYARFKSVISQVPSAMQLIPAHVEESADAEGKSSADVFYEYEPEESEILADLLPRNVSVQLFRVLLENVAGEYGAKMSAMDGATRNAGDVIDKLSILYNRTRQGKITNELIEIISGANAL